MAMELVFPVSFAGAEVAAGEVPSGLLLGPSPYNGWKWHRSPSRRWLILLLQLGNRSRSKQQ